MSQSDIADDINRRLESIEAATAAIRATMLKNPNAAREWAAHVKIEANAVWLALPSIRR